MRNMLTFFAIVLFSELGGLIAELSILPNRLEIYSTAQFAIFFLIAAGLYAAMLYWLVSRSRLRGVQLLTTLIIVYFGTRVFMVQNDLYFIAEPLGITPQAIIAESLSSLIPIILSSIAAVWFFSPKEVTPKIASQKGPFAWLWRLAVVDVVYLFAYLGAGLFILNFIPAVTEYYDGRLDDVNGLAQLGSQLIRGLLWAGIVIVLVNSLKGGRGQLALISGLTLVVFFCTALLIPTEILPLGVRMGHLLETTSSNFVFGFIAGFLLYPLVHGRKDYSNETASVTT